MSYSHEDAEVARRLHKFLEGFRPPKGLSNNWERAVGSLHPIFRDEDELASAKSLPNSIQGALADSDNLIVLCSPASAASDWVNEEIRYFQRGRGADHIWPIIVNGHPPDCFPAALLEAQPQPFAPNIDGSRDGFETAALKLAAALLGVDFGVLKDREAVRQRRRTHLTVAIATTFAALAIISVFAGWRALEDRNQAIESARFELGRKLAAEARIAINEGSSIEDFERAAALSLEAWRRTPTLQAYNAATSSLPKLPLAKLTGDFFPPLEMNPDGDILLTWNGLETVHVISTANFTEVASFSSPPVTQFDFSGDGLLLAVGSWHRVKIVETKQWAEIANFDLSDEITSIALNHDGSKLAVSSQPASLSLFDVQRGTRISQSDLEETFSSLNFIGESDGVSAIASNSSIVSFNPLDGRMFNAFQLEEHVNLIAFSPSNSWIAYTSRRSFPTSGTKSVALAHLGSSSQFGVINHGEEVHYLEFSDAGERLAVGSVLGSLQIIDVWNSTEITRIEHGSPLLGLSLSPDGKYVVTLSGENSDTLRRFEVGNSIQRATEISKMIVGDSEAHLLSAFSYDGSRAIYAGAYDETAWIVDTDTGQVVNKIRLRPSTLVVALDKKGELLALGDAFGTTSVFNSASGKLVGIAKHSGVISSLSFNQEGDKLLVGNGEGAAAVFDVFSGTKLFELEHKSEITDAEFTLDGTRILTASGDGAVIVSEVQTGRRIFVSKFDSRVGSATFSRGGEFVAAASVSGELAIIDAQDGTDIARTDFGDWPIDIIEFSSDGARIAIAEKEGRRTRLLDARNAIELSRIRGDGMVESISFHPNSTYLASATSEGVIRILDAREGRELARIEKLGWIKDIAYSEDGERLTAIGFDGTIRSFTVHPSDVIEQVCRTRSGRNLTREEWRQHIGDSAEWKPTCETWSSDRN